MMMCVLSRSMQHGPLMAQYANSRTMKGFGSWQHFLKFLWEKDGQSAQCKLCKTSSKQSVDRQKDAMNT